MIKKLNKFKKVFAVACAIAMIAEFAPATTASAATTKVTYNAPSSAKIGDTIKIGVNVSNVSGLYGGAVDFAYDSSVLDVTDIKIGSLFNNAEADVVKKANGEANVAFTLKGAATPVTGSGELAVITAKVKKEGTVNLTTGNDYSQLGKNANVVVKLADKNATKIAYDATNSKIEIVGQPTEYLTPGKYTEKDTKLKYTGSWQDKTGPNYLGGTLKTATAKGAALEFSFKGTAFEWFGLKANSRGIADVYIDGNKISSIDCYRNEILYNKVLYRSPELSNTVHTVKIVASGNQNALAKNFGIDVDQIVIKDSSLVLNAGTYQDDNISLDFLGSWVSKTSTNYSGGSLMNSITKDSTCQFKFNGTSFEWYGLKAPSRGIAKIYIDGKEVSTVDCYSAKNVYGQALYKSNTLANGTHTVKIVTTGSKNAKAVNFGIDVDKIVIK